MKVIGLNGWKDTFEKDIIYFQYHFYQPSSKDDTLISNTLYQVFNMTANEYEKQTRTFRRMNEVRKDVIRNVLLLER